MSADKSAVPTPNHLEPGTLDPHQTRRQLRAFLKGKQLSEKGLRDLRKQALIAGGPDNPTLTAKGRALLSSGVRPVMTGKPKKALPESDHQPSMQTPADIFDGLPIALDRMARPRKGEAPLLSSSTLLAARRFRLDLDRAGLGPRITQSWSLAALVHQASKRQGSDGSHELDAMLDARDRVNHTCKSIGPDFSGLLIDVCLMDKNLASIERERQWPARSAKLVIALGLKALARHYGLTDQTSD